jgi:hypothetical protein
MLLCGQLRLRRRLPLAPRVLARARELVVPAALVLPLSSQSS